MDNMDNQERREIIFTTEETKELLKIARMSLLWRTILIPFLTGTGAFIGTLAALNEMGISFFRQH